MNTANQVIFSERALNAELQLYAETAEDPAVIDGHVLLKIFKVSQLPSL
jgi:hypothetical protein